MNERLLLRPTEAAHAIGISRSKCYELIQQRVLPSVRIGGSVRIPVVALEQWIADELAASGFSQQPNRNRANGEEQ
jgi:excisionase family DNA binding protein